MSLIGSVGLSNNQNGLFLGQVNVDNADEFALTANSIYVNDNIKTIQSAVDNVTQADVIYISSGSYGEAVTIRNKYNMALVAPSVGAVANTLCEILNGVVIDGTSELVRLNNLQIKGANSQIFGVGRNRCNNIVFTGTAVQTNFIEIGKASTNFIIFTNCEFDNYCNVTVHSTFASVVYFINCNFGSCTLTLSQASPLQVIINNCSGFVSFPVNATYYGMNVLASGTANLTTTNINGSTPATSNVSVTSQADHRIVTGTTTNDILHCNQTLTWDDTQLSLFNSSALTIGRGNSASSAVSNCAVGHQSLNSIGTGSNNTAIGHQALSSVINNSNNTAIGASQTSGTSTSQSVIVGSVATCTNDNSVVIGYSSKGSNSGVTIGSGSGRSAGNYNTVCGRNSFNNAGASSAGYNCILGPNCATANMTGNYNNIVGATSGTAITSGSNNCIIGTSAGNNITTHSNNSFVGYNSGSTGTAYSNCSILGANVNVLSANNQVQLGDSSTTTYAYGAVQDRSDSRDKNFITDTDLGLDFINELHPVKFRWNYREDYKEVSVDENGNTTITDLPMDGSKTRNRYHYGLIAQEVENTMNKLGVDFGGLQHHSVKGGDDKYTLGYNELICPLIKAVQQLTERIKILENK